MPPNFQTDGYPFQRRGDLVTACAYTDNVLISRRAITVVVKCLISPRNGNGLVETLLVKHAERTGAGTLFLSLFFFIHLYLRIHRRLSTTWGEVVVIRCQMIKTTPPKRITLLVVSRQQTYDLVSCIPVTVKVIGNAVIGVIQTVNLAIAISIDQPYDDAIR
ncbi:hypothetical protein Y5W_02890 [Alcanivorax sp. 521-1]|uniref:Uncharacterized protein n=1 Tax=Alloalcanivorax profundimaris TaxID=2735259 RepID=A0ABS0ATZ5_9GAMM|nr:hypothetical protein [Alloalcanivorax profundimaris]